MSQRFFLIIDKEFYIYCCPKHSMLQVSKSIFLAVFSLQIVLILNRYLCKQVLLNRVLFSSYFRHGIKNVSYFQHCSHRTTWYQQDKRWFLLVCWPHASRSLQFLSLSLRETQMYFCGIETSFCRKSSRENEPKYNHLFTFFVSIFIVNIWFQTHLLIYVKPILLTTHQK